MTSTRRYSSPTRWWVLSPRPGRIREILPVDLRRPRGRGIVTDPRFAALKAHCLSLLFDGEADGAGDLA